MSRNDVILGAVALVLVGFSLVVSLLVPRSRPDFPGKSLRAFLVFSAVLVIAMLAAVEVFGEAHDPGHSAKAKEEAADTGGVDTGAVTTVPPTTTQAETGETGETTEDETGESGDPAAGADVYASAGCGSCHVLQAAGSTGSVGPNLDESDVTFDEAVEQIANGGNGMPAFEGQLSETQINDVAAFVVEGTAG